MQSLRARDALSRLERAKEALLRQHTPGKGQRQDQESREREDIAEHGAEFVEQVPPVLWKFTRQLRERAQQQDVLQQHQGRVEADEHQDKLELQPRQDPFDAAAALQM